VLTTGYHYFVGGTTAESTDALNLGDGKLDSCTGYSSSGPDDILRVRLAPGQTIDAVLDPTAYADTVLYLVTDCGDPDTCVEGSDSGNPEEVSYTSKSGEVLYLVVDAYMSSTTFDYVLEVDIY